MLNVEDIKKQDYVLKFNLTPLYRASYNIHIILRVPERFRDYYYSNRQLQLDSDLLWNGIIPNFSSSDCRILHRGGSID